MNKSFLTAFITPKEWDVIGYKLKPFSVRRFINFTAVESPFVTGQVPSARDTVAFLKFCSSDCESIIDMPIVTLYDIVAYARLKYDPMFHVSTIKAICNYMKEQTGGPVYRIAFSNKAKSKVLVSDNGIPEMLTLVSACMAKLHMTEKEAFNMPIGRLCWYAASISALEGADVRVSEEEENTLSEMNKLIEWEKEQAEKLRLSMVNGKIPKKRIITASN